MIVMYHNIGLETGFNTVALRDIKEQLSYLKKYFNIVSIDKYICEMNSSCNNVVITVDDAYKSFKELVLPILKELNIPAVLFVPVDLVGKYNSWDREKRIDIMSWDDLRVVSAEELVTIGSHGNSHKRISHLQDNEIIDEIIGSKKRLEEELKVEVKHFSYPFGQLCDYKKYAVDGLKNAGYDSACSTRYGRKNSKNNRYELYRIEVEPSDKIASFKRKCENNVHPKLFKRFVKEMLIKTGIIK